MKGSRKIAAEKAKEWEEKFLDKVRLCHVRMLPKVVARILKRVNATKTSLNIRSKKHDVECNVTIEELRQLVYDAYGKKCKYCDNILSINNLVFDHIIPISAGGNSNITNLQIICKKSNGMKGSLHEEHFNILLQWLDTVPDELKRDIGIRLARGVV